MSNKFAILAALLTAIFMWAGCKDDNPSEPLPDFKSQLQEHVVHSTALMGNAFNDPIDRKVMVYTPPGYDPNGEKRYPVVYLLHGLPLSDSTFISPEAWAGMNEVADFRPEGFTAWIDTLIAQQAIAPMILVMPETKTLYGFCFYTNSVLQGNYEDYITQDLVGYIDANFKTISTRDGRAVIGHSQGGYGAMRMGLLHADVFSVVASHSGTLYFDGLKAGTPFVIAENPNGMMGPEHGGFMTRVTYGMAAAWSPNLQNPPYQVDLPFVYPSGQNIPAVWDRWLEHDPYTLLNTHAADLLSLRGLYLDCGTQDGWYGLSQFYDQALTSRNIPHTFESFTGTHFNKLISRVEVSLAYCSAHIQH
ncbi:MAG TPA: alpha/beta hydrolase-fold protein [Saprospiraceae bacterium]|nr:alpha/beta hydrolase-fold protein [Saprospiraceae bacterium]